MKKILFIFSIVLLFSCGGTSNSEVYLSDDSAVTSTNASEGNWAEEYEEQAIIEREKAESNHDKTNIKEEQTAQKNVRKLIREGYIDIQVEDIENASGRLKALVKANNGYFSNESSTKENRRIVSNYTIRVPEARFDSVVNKTGAIAKNIDRKQISVKDVTEDYYDTQARLKTKKKAEERYLEILQSAKTIADVLEVEDKLRIIREEIEAKEGHLRLLKDLIGFSTIHVSMYQYTEYEYQGAERPNFGQKLLSALDNGWGGLLSFIIGFIYLWPFWIILAVILFFVRKYFKKRK